MPQRATSRRSRSRQSQCPRRALRSSDSQKNTSFQKWLGSLLLHSSVPPLDRSDARPRLRLPARSRTPPRSSACTTMPWVACDLCCNLLVEFVRPRPIRDFRKTRNQIEFFIRPYVHCVVKQRNELKCLRSCRIRAQVVPGRKHVLSHAPSSSFTPSAQDVD